jgi:mannose-6-phosphate isomerase
MELREAFRLEPEYRDYVWGGSRLRPEIVPTAEAWVIYANDRIASGPAAGKTLGQAAAEYGPALLGTRPVADTGLRFPLLVKLLDCAAWLSLQVHPNDEQARRLEGEGMFGKTEAWHFLEADPGSTILCGLQPGSTQAEMAEAIRSGKLLDCMQRLPAQTGDSIFIRPGMIHALGPGLLVYEVQQTSDITYRVWDWDRPQTEKRRLHIDKSIEVADSSASGKMIDPPAFVDGAARTLVSCPFFTMQLLTARANPVTLDPHGETFHALTVLSGRARVEGSGWSLELGPLQSALAPADAGAYQVTPLSELRMLKAAVESKE